MKLKALEIQGFKSFPDRTKLEFTDGITAVVGPNGSGKSNIADAVRWVLGEQSTRTLRGVKMEDVIFNGTQSRKSQGTASVTLFIDNTSRTLPFDEDLVSITRRLYRSGDSEYRINGAMVRLKDIYEMFMDTGLGRDGYSIIGQGKIAEIVSAKGKERREIFEEAAGIAKYRYRKTEAERRLAMADENMLRLKDILSELQGRVEPLQREAKKAAEFLGYAEEKKTLEISVWTHSLSGITAALRQQNDLLMASKSDLDKADTETASAESHTTSLFENMQACILKIEELRTELKSAGERISQFESESAVLQNDIQHNTRSIAEAREEIDSSCMSRGEMEEELKKKGREISDKRIEAEKIRIQIEEASAALDGVQAEQNASMDELDKLRLRRSGLFEGIEKAKLMAASSTTLIGESKNRLGGLSADAEIRVQNLERIRGEIADCEELISGITENIGTLQNYIKGYELKRQGRQEKLTGIRTKENELMTKAGELRQRARLLSDLDKNMEGFASSVKYIVKQAETGQLKGIHGPISKIIDTDNRYSTAIETALGQALQNIVVDSEEVAKRAINMLSTSKSGRATFLPITSVKGTSMEAGSFQKEKGFLGIASALVTCAPAYRGVVDWILGRIVIADNLDNAVSMAKNNGYRFRVVTLDGQMVNAGGSMTGGYTARSVGILGRQGEIDRLLAQADGIEKDAGELSRQAAELDRDLSAIQAEIVATQAQQKSGGEDEIRYSAELRQLRNTLAEAEASMTNAKEEERLLALRIDEMHAASTDAAELLILLEKDMAQVQLEIAGLTDKRAASQLSATEGAALISQLTTGQMLCEKDIELLSLGEEQLRVRLTAGDKRNADLTLRTEELTAKNQEITLRIGTLQKEKETLSLESSSIQEAIMHKSREREACEQQTAKLRGELKQISARREIAYREMVRLEEKKNSLQSENDSTVAKLWDEYELTLSQALEQAVRLEDPQKAGRQLIELRNKIKAIGSVNLSAIEEYKEVSARYEFLGAQLADVERSKAELMRMIGELTFQMQEIFSKNFTLIAQNFSLIFTELFGGGRANLTLSEAGDILESGIDIMVQPPGKLIKNLAELSGGEQAFVAIAIYFAIMKVNPAPFCLIDEIEAALDDVNVTKFAQYMRRMTDKTQFIAITHRRGTMEEADVLYGVTMQEEGVSKLLQLNVAEVEGKLGIK